MEEAGLKACTAKGWDALASLYVEHFLYEQEQGNLMFHI